MDKRAGLGFTDSSDWIPEQIEYDSTSEVFKKLYRGVFPKASDLPLKSKHRHQNTEHELIQDDTKTIEEPSSNIGSAFSMLPSIGQRNIPIAQFNKDMKSESGSRNANVIQSDRQVYKPT